MSQGGPYKRGQRFGPYVLEEYLGAGAFKSVFIGTGLSGPVSLLVVPEPTTLAVLGMGVVALVRKKIHSRK